MAPYIPLVEAGHVNADVVGDLVARGLVPGPVLVVGAGHGLLVEALLAAGLEVQAVDYLPDAVEGARVRRGVTVQLAEAIDLPFADGRFPTVIVASGVVDFLDDHDELHAIVDEAVRVTSPGGRTLVGFWSLDPGALAFFRGIGLLVDGRLKQRETFALSRQGPVTLLRGIAGRVGWGRALRLVLERFLFLPPQERAQAMALARIWKTDPDPDGLLAAVPASVPLHAPDDIVRLLAPHGAATCHPYPTCTVAVLDKAG